MVWLWQYCVSSILISEAPNTVQMHAAVCKIQERVLAVFAIYTGDSLVIEPDQIQAILKNSSIAVPKQIRVLPWLTPKVEFDLLNEPKLKVTLNYMNNLVDQIDKEDPWYTFIHVIFTLICQGSKRTLECQEQEKVLCGIQ
jgi:hypothetical protein